MAAFRFARLLLVAAWAFGITWLGSAAFAFAFEPFRQATGASVTDPGTGGPEPEPAALNSSPRP